MTKDEICPLGVHQVPCRCRKGTGLYKYIDDLVTVDTDKSGRFTTEIVLPEKLDAGNYGVKVKYDLVGSLEIIENNPPIIQLDKQTGYSGDTITIKGIGFVPGDGLRIIADSSHIQKEVATIVADANGNISGVFEMIEVKSTEFSTVNISVRGKKSSPAVAFKVYPSREQTIKLCPTSGYRDSAVTVIGTGFKPDQKISLNAQCGSKKWQICEVAADGNGSFDKDIAANGPITEPNYLFITAEQNDDSFARAAFFVDSLTKPTIVSAKLWGDDFIKIKGSGFTPNDQLTIGVEVEGRIVVTRHCTVSDSKGNFEAKFEDDTILHSGWMRICALGKTSCQLISFYLKPNKKEEVKINPTSAAPGGKVTIDGSGFEPNTSLTIRFDEPPLKPIETDVDTALRQTAGLKQGEWIHFVKAADFKEYHKYRNGACLNVEFYKLGKDKWFASLKVKGIRFEKKFRDTTWEADYFKIYYWKYVRTKKMIRQILEAFSQNHGILDLGWTQKFTKTTREIDRTEAVRVAKRMGVKNYDYSENEYLRLRNIALEKKLRPSALRVFDVCYEKSVTGTLRHEAQLCIDESRGMYAAMGYDRSLRNYAKIARIIKTNGLKSEQVKSIPYLCPYSNPEVIPRPTLERWQRRQKRAKQKEKTK